MLELQSFFCQSPSTVECRNAHNHMQNFNDNHHPSLLTNSSTTYNHMLTLQPFFCQSPSTVECSNAHNHMQNFDDNHHLSLLTNSNTTHNHMLKFPSSSANHH